MRGTSEIEVRLRCENHSRTVHGYGVGGCVMNKGGIIGVGEYSDIISETNNACRTSSSNEGEEDASRAIELRDTLKPLRC